MAAVEKILTFKKNSLTSQPDGTATITIVETSKDGDTTVGVVELDVQILVVKVQTIS